MLLGGLVAAGVGAAAACGKPGAGTVWTAPAASESFGTGSGVKPLVEPAPNRSAPTPKQVTKGAPYAKAVTDVLTKYLKPTSDNPAHPGYAGAVALVKDGGRTLLRTAVGDAERPGRSADHGLGVEMNQPWFMGKLAAPTSFGHTGFTGTSLLVVPDREMVVVLLTNRAHPNWSWSNPDTHRVAVADAIAAD